MTTDPRHFFSHLPPELRNEVYNYLSTPESTSIATIVGLPLKLKTYEFKHTTVQICPVHYGSNGFLAIQMYRFQEACEYSSWLRNNAVELKIGVVFGGRVNTFVQQDWDKKMEAHLRKLVKLHLWLKKVAKYDIQVLWSPADGVLKSKNSKRTARKIARDMIRTLTTLMDGDVKKRRGDIKVKLRLTHDVAMKTVCSSTRFGFVDFLLRTENTFRRQKLEIWKEVNTKPPPEIGSRLMSIPSTKQEEKSLLEAEKGPVRWLGTTQHLVIKKQMVHDRTIGVVTKKEEDPETDIDYIVSSLSGECLISL